MGFLARLFGREEADRQAGTAPVAQAAEPDSPIVSSQNVRLTEAEPDSRGPATENDPV